MVMWDTFGLQVGFERQVFESFDTHSLIIPSELSLRQQEEDHWQADTYEWQVDDEHVPPSKVLGDGSTNNSDH